jgi:hypothetical protein
MRVSAVPHSPNPREEIIRVRKAGYDRETDYLLQLRETREADNPPPERIVEPDGISATASSALL